MTKQPSAMNNIKSILRSIERYRSSLYRAYKQLIEDTVILHFPLTSENRRAKMADRIEGDMKYISDLEGYLSDMDEELKYQIAQYQTEHDTNMRSIRKELDKARKVS